MEMIEGEGLTLKALPELPKENKKCFEVPQSQNMPDNIKNGPRSDSGTLKLDSSGLPLIPQPTASPIDPLNYPDVCVLAPVSYRISNEDANLQSGLNISFLFKRRFLLVYPY